MGLSAHFHQHKIVHLVWLIAVLLGIIAFLALRVPAGEVLRDFMAFAASIASLILAVIAIFYSAISNQNFSETVGTLRESTSHFGDAASSITSTSERLSQQVDRLGTQLSELPPALQEISQKVDRRFQADVEAPTMPVVPSGQADQDPTSKLLAQNTTVGAVAAIYMMARASKEKTAFSPMDINLPGERIRAYISGYLQAFVTTKSYGVDIEFVDRKFIVNSLGSLDADVLIERARAGGKAKGHKERLATIDAFFDTSASEAGSAESE